MELEQAAARIHQLERELAVTADKSAKQQLQIAALQQTIADKNKRIAEQQDSIEAFLAAQRQYEHVKTLAGEVIKQQQQRVKELEQQVENLNQDLTLVKQHLAFVKKQYDDHSQHHLIQTICNSKTLEVAQAKRSQLQKLCEQQEAQLKVMEQLLSVHKSSPAGALPVSIQANPVTVAAPQQPSMKVKTAAANKLLAVKTSSNRSKVITAVKQPLADSVQAPGTPTTGNSRATSDSGVVRASSNRSRSSSNGSAEALGLGWLGTAAASVVGSINTASVSSNPASTTSSCPGSPSTSSSSISTDSSITTIFSSWWSSAANMLMDPAYSSSEVARCHAAASWW